MTDLADGAKVEVQGSGANRYTLEHKGGVYSCTCPAWRNQTTRIEQRTCKHLRAYLGDAVETARVGASAPPPRRPPNDRVRAPLVRRFVEDREVRAEREAALATALERHPVLNDRMQIVYGLRMPRHLAYGIGWWMGLSPVERKEAWAYVGNGPDGVGEWFLDDALERRVKPGLDERLQARYRCDPPEMVTIFSGNSDGGHWGLWYDDPKKLPTAIVMNYARDSAETWPCKRTLLETFHEQVAGADEPWTAEEWPHRAAILAWLEEVLEREIEAFNDERLFVTSGARPEHLIGGMASIDPGFVLPPELASYSEQEKRYQAYKNRDPVVREWIALAMSELAAGQPGRALFLGRELHWLDSDEWRRECTELLVGAYKALDRHALAEIVKVHHEHRDLPLVDVYEAPAPNPYLSKVDDVEALRAAMKERPPTEKEIRSLLHHQTQLPLLEVLLEAPAAAAAFEAIAAEHVDEVQSLSRLVAESPTLRESLEAHRAGALRIFERCGATGRAFSSALQLLDDDLRASAIRHADLEWRSTRGRSVLHLAARAGDASAVDELLRRGADALARDQDGKTPYDSAREAWQSAPREANRIFELLTARGGGPPPAPKPVVDEGAWLPGAAVKHAKFGDGFVESVTGAGEEAKLTIRFASATKTLVAKFVTRA